MCFLFSIEKFISFMSGFAQFLLSSLNISEYMCIKLLRSEASLGMMLFAFIKGGKRG